MKIRLSNTQFLDAQGNPLDGGRVTVYVNDSDVPATLYEVAGDEYVQTANPQTCGLGGFIPAVYFDAGIVSVVVEKANGDGTYSVVDTYQDGFEVDGGSNPNGIIEGISGLKDVEPSSGMVCQVHANGMMLDYVYDPNCTNADDDGVVVASLHGNGKWILLYDCDSLPCTVYGITPGNEANINAFLQFPDNVGQWAISTPSKCRFLEGTYTTNANLTCLKTIVFDRGTQFTDAVFSVPSIIAEPDNGKYIADFVFTKNNSEAHSSWFKGVAMFWGCNAQKFVIDRNDYFVDKNIGSTVTITNRTIEGAGKRIDATYSSGACLKISNCSITGSNIFSPLYDSLWFYGMEFKQGWFNNSNVGNYDFGFISQGHRLDVRENQENKIDIDNFTEVGIYVKAMVFNGYTSLDLKGNTLNTLLMDQVTYLSNASVNTLTLGAATATLVNVNASTLKATYASGTSLTLTDSNVNISAGPNLSAIVATDSNVTVNGSAGVDPATCSVIVRGGNWYGNIKLTRDELDTFAPHATVSFIDTIIDWSTFSVNHLYMERCTANVKINLYAYKSGDHNYLEMTLIGNTFTASNSVGYIWMGYFADANSQHSEVDSHPLEFSFVRIVDNKFFQSDTKGIYMTRWTYYGYNKAVSDSIANWEYHGNIGNCPRLSPSRVLGSSFTTTSGIYAVCATPCNVFAPFANKNDGSVNAAKDCSGVTAGAEIVDYDLFPSTFSKLIGGYSVGLSIPSDTFDDEQNNIFMVKPCVTNGLSAPTLDAGAILAWDQYVNCK